MAVYEFESEATFQRFLESGHLEELKREYDAHFERGLGARPLGLRPGVAVGGPPQGHRPTSFRSIQHLKKPRAVVAVDPGRRPGHVPAPAGNSSERGAPLAVIPPRNGPTGLDGGKSAETA